MQGLLCKFKVDVNDNNAGIIIDITFLSADADVAGATDCFANANLSNLNELVFVITNGFNLRELVSAGADVATPRIVSHRFHRFLSADADIRFQMGL